MVTKHRHTTLPLVSLLMISICLASCNDGENLSTDPTHRLVFSSDTISFDTLFTDISSATHSFLIYNRNRAALSIPEIRLAGGGESPFRINIDGQSGTAFNEITIRGNDSLYAFVEVTVDPRGETDPFEVLDSLIFTLQSGMVQQVQLRAYGQDVTVLRGWTVTTDTILTAYKPYLIYDSLHVGEGVTLQLESGVRLHFYDKAEMQVYGSIKAIGTKDSPITFRGARTDRMFSYLPYDRIPAQWGGITLHETSTDNIFVHCDIHSGVYGLKAKNTDMSHVKLVMQNSQIHNTEEDALQLTLCSASLANSLFTNAGGHCVNILGGQMDFLHCTIANFFPWSSERGAAVNISNYSEEENTLYPLLGVNFINSIITGSKDDELSGSVLTETDSVDYSEYAHYLFSYSLINSIKEAREPDSLHFSHIVWEHQDSTAYSRSNFRTIDHTNFVYDFHLDSLSCARGIASDKYLDTVPYDKDEQSRHDARSIDAGCYQYIGYGEETKE